MNHYDKVVGELIKVAWDRGIMVTPEMVEYMNKEVDRILNSLKYFSNKNNNLNEARTLVSELPKPSKSRKVSGSRVFSTNKVWNKTRTIQKISKGVRGTRYSKNSWRVCGVRGRL